MPRREKKKERHHRHRDSENYDYTYDNAYSGYQYPDYNTPDYTGYGGTLKGSALKTWDPRSHDDTSHYNNFPTNMFGLRRSRSADRIKDSSSGSSSRETRRNKPLIIGIVFAMVCVLVIIGVALGLLVFASDSSPNKSSTGTPAEFTGSLSLNKPWNPKYLDTNSAEYKALLQNFLTMMDAAFGSSNLNSNYAGTTLTQLSQGSVICVFVGSFQSNVIGQSILSPQLIKDTLTTSLASLANDPNIAATIQQLIAEVVPSTIQGTLRAVATVRTTTTTTTTTPTTTAPTTTTPTTTTPTTTTPTTTTPTTTTPTTTTPTTTTPTTTTPTTTTPTTTTPTTTTPTTTTPTTTTPTTTTPTTTAPTTTTPTTTAPTTTTPTTTTPTTTTPTTTTPTTTTPTTTTPTTTTPTTTTPTTTTPTTTTPSTTTPTTTTPTTTTPTTTTPTTTTPTTTTPTDVPTVTVSNRDVIVTAGDNVTLSCNVTGYPNVTEVYWQRMVNGGQTETLAVDGVSYTGVTLDDPYLTITNVKVADSAVYICKANNSVGTGSSASVTLMVQDVPTVTVSNRDMIVTAGDNVTLSCNVTGYPNVTEVYWQRMVNGGQAETLAVDGVSHTGVALDDPSLTITNVKVADSAVYICKANNSVGTGSSASVTLMVQDIPTVTVSIKEYTVTAGDNVTLACNVTGYPNVTEVYWQRMVNGGEAETLAVDGVSYTGVTPDNPSLTIINVKVADSAVYICKANNSVGTGSSPSVTLMVQDVPTASVPSTSVNGDVGDNVTLACNVTGNPPVVDVYWQKTSNDTDFETIVIDGTNYQGVTLGDASLTIVTAGLADSAIYICKANNSIGTGSSSSVTLNVTTVAVEYSGSLSLNETFDNQLLNKSSQEYKDKVAEFVDMMDNNVLNNVTGTQTQVLGFSNGSTQVLFVTLFIENVFSVGGTDIVINVNIITLVIVEAIQDLQNQNLSGAPPMYSSLLTDSIRGNGLQKQDDCAQNPCFNGGSCTDLFGDYECTCPPGYSGKDCSEDLDVCVADSCYNGGTCVEGVADLYSCVCDQLFTGDYCETRLCGDEWCHNNGTCVPGNTTAEDYCNCATQLYAGTYCEIQTRLCGDEWCHNNGTCVPGNTTAEDYCNCATQLYAGTYCEIPFCGSNWCHNGGTCVGDDGNYCDCESKYTGPHCTLDKFVYLQGPTGSFSSVNYPNPYPDRVDMTWIISMAPEDVVLLQFSTFDLAGFDNIAVIDGSQISSPLIDSFIGHNIPGPFLSTGPNMTVQFHSDSSSVDRGFRASYTSDPVLYLYGPTGYFTSPNYPDKYNIKVELTWLITVEPNEAVLLTCITFDTENTYDFLHVYDGPNVSSPRIASLTGNILPYPFRSTYRYMTVVFSSDNSVTKPGFNVTYSSTSETGNYGGLQGTIYSPNYPQYYSPFADIKWFIVLDPKYYVNLTFEVFDLETFYDFLHVYDGSDVTAPLIGSFTGINLPYPVSSTGNEMLLHLESDNIMQGQGFKINYVAIKIPCLVGMIMCLDTSCLNISRTCDDVIDCPSGFDEWPCLKDGFDENVIIWVDCDIEVPVPVGHDVLSLALPTYLPISQFDVKYLIEPKFSDNSTRSRREVSNSDDSPQRFLLGMRLSSTTSNPINSTLSTILDLLPIQLLVFPIPGLGNFSINIRSVEVQHMTPEELYPGQPNLTASDVRLTGGPSCYQGRVEVKNKGVWGTVCASPDWGPREAAVVCGMLGLGSDHAMAAVNMVAHEDVPIWLGGVSCSGKENSLSDCDHDTWGITPECDPEAVYAATVVCDDREPILKCTFEEGDICAMTSTGEGHWYTTAAGDHYDEATGPHNAMGGESYMLYNSDRNSYNIPAILQTPIIMGGSPVCLSFYYFLYGHEIGKFHVYDSFGGTIMEVRGDQGRRWHFMQVTLNHTMDFQVYFETTNSKVFIYNGDVAIDEVYVVTGECVDEGVVCSLPPMVPTVAPTQDTLLSCMFGDGKSRDMCGFSTAVITGRQDWLHSEDLANLTIRAEAQLPSPADGNYMFYYDEAGNATEGDSAVLVSPTFDTSSHSRLVFHVHAAGLSLLSVKTNTTAPIPVWSRSENEWSYKCINLPANVTASLIFTASLGPNHEGHIAVKDVAVESGNCPGPGSCTFNELGDCGYRPLSNPDMSLMEWKKMDLSDTASFPLDHTTMSSTGGIYRSSQYNGIGRRYDGFSSWLLSPVFNSQSVSSVIFHLIKGGHSRLVAGLIPVADIKENQTLMEVLHVHNTNRSASIVAPLLVIESSDDSNSWQSYCVDLSDAQERNISFVLIHEGVDYDQTSHAYVYVDDISMETESCQRSLDTCDWDDLRTCGISYDADDVCPLDTDFRWQLLRTNDDHLLMTDSSNGYLGDTATVYLDSGSSTGQSVWWKYRFRSEETTSFNVIYGTYEDVVKNTYPVDNWQTYCFRVPSENRTQLRLETQKGRSPLSDVGIADISLSDSSCPEVTANCSFETTCGYAFDEGWDINTDPRTPAEYYLSIHTTYSEYQYRSVLSPHVAMETVSPSCVEFWYRMKMSIINDKSYIKVNLFDLGYDVTMPMEVLKITYGSHSWLKRQFNVTVPHYRFQFHAVSDTITEYGIDNIMVTEGTCHPLDCGDALFSCGSGDMCIAMEDVCDSTLHCPGGEDELNCGSMEADSFNCSFEHSNMCGYRTFLSDISQSSLCDHSEDGSGFGLKLSYGQNTVGFTMQYLESPQVNIETHSCLTFYVFGQNDLPLRASIKHMDGHIDRIGDCVTHIGEEVDWYRTSLDIPAGNYSLIFEAGEYFMTRNFEMCLDDIGVINGESCDKIGCGPNEFLCRNSSLCIAAKHLCDSYRNCPDGEDEDDCNLNTTCDFDGDWCGYDGDLNNGYLWQSTPSLSYWGITLDSETGSGSFLYTGCPHTYLYNISLSGPRNLPSVNGSYYCLHFSLAWFHPYFFSYSKLRVDLYQDYSDMETRWEGTEKGKQEAVWETYKVDLGYLWTYMRVVFSATTYQSFVALDNVTLVVGRCEQEFSTTDVPSSTTTTTASGSTNGSTSTANTTDVPSSATLTATLGSTNGSTSTANTTDVPSSTTPTATSGSTNGSTSTANTTDVPSSTATTATSGSTNTSLNITSATPTADYGMCDRISDDSQCNKYGYRYTSMPNVLCHGFTWYAEYSIAMAYVGLVSGASPECEDALTAGLCAVHLPVCWNDTVTQPCKHHCEKYFEVIKFCRPDLPDFTYYKNICALLPSASDSNCTEIHSIENFNLTTPAASTAATANSTAVPPPSSTADPCVPNLCKNGGTCVSQSGGNTTCSCAPGFWGILCETVVDCDLIENLQMCGYRYTSAWISTPGSLGIPTWKTKEGQQDYITTPNLTTSTGDSLHFSYKLSGSALGLLTLTLNNEVKFESDYSLTDSDVDVCVDLPANTEVSAMFSYVRVSDAGTDDIHNVVALNYIKVAVNDTCSGFVEDRACDFDGAGLCGIELSSICHPRDGGYLQSPSPYAWKAKPHDSNTGFFLFADGSYGEPGNEAIAMLPVVHLSANDNIRLRYLSSSANSNITADFKVYVSEDLVFWRNIVTEGKWEDICIPLETVVTNDRYANLKIVSSHGSSNSMDVGWDAINISSERCPHVANCNFENYLNCGYTTESNPINGTTAFKFYKTESCDGPDHTWNGTGSMMCAKQCDSGPSSAGDVTTLVSPTFELESSEQISLTFFFRMSGDSVGGLEIFLESDQDPQQLFVSRSGNHGDRWYEVCANLPVPSVNKSVTLTSNAVHGDGCYGSYALDDFEFRYSTCPEILVDLPCNFYQPYLCGYDVSTTNGSVFRWDIGQGSTPSADTGPHSDGEGRLDGSYVYVRGSDARPGDVSTLCFPSVSSANMTAPTLRFMYHMKGEGGNLSVVVRGNVVWTRSGHQDGNWLHACESIPVDPDVQICFEATANQNVSDIALDDILIKDENCQAPSVNCTFDNLDHVCEYISTSDGQPTSSWRQAYQDENNFAAGYVMASGRAGQDDTESLLLSPPVLSSRVGVHCVAFDYLVTAGSETTYADILSVSLTHRNGSKDHLLAFGPKHDVGWNRAQAEFNNDPNDLLRILFARHYSSAAIDAVVVTEGACPALDCKAGQFNCTEWCVPSDWQCDRYFDCGGEEDEAGCGMSLECDFRYEYQCGYGLPIDADMNMGLERVRTMWGGTKTIFGNDGPSTRDTNQDFFLGRSELKSSFPPEVSIMSPMLAVTERSCLHFSYVGNMASLHVTDNNNGSFNDSAFALSTEWRPGQLTLGVDEAAVLTYTARPDPDVTSDYSFFGLDSIYLTPGECPQVIDCGDGYYCTADHICIPKAATCDGQKDCSDGSDEEPCETSISCDFEHQFACGYWTDQANGWEWRQAHRHNLPNVDHTFQNVSGHYFYVESSLRSELNFHSPPQAVSGGCVSFYYNMEEGIAAELQVYVSENDTDFLEMIENGENIVRDQWVFAQFPLPAGDVRNVSIRFQFTGDSIKVFPGSLAIDDVMYTEETCERQVTCEPYSFHCNTSDICIPYNMERDGVQDCPDGSDENADTYDTLPAEGRVFECRFESEVEPDCWLTQSQHDDSFWTRNEDETPSSLTGPNHAVEGSWYMYYETSFGVDESDIAAMHTGLRTIDNTSCLYFYYNMFGESMGKLAIYVERNQSRTEVWTRSGNQGPQWFLDQVTVPSGNLDIIIEGTDGDDYQGDMAIDYVVLVDGACPPTDNNSASDPVFDELRLVGGDRVSYGRVELAANNDSFQALCSYSWTEENTIVACRQLGFGPDGITTRLFVGGDYASIRSNRGLLFGAFSCNGTEKMLSECNFTKTLCTSTDQAAIACSNDVCIAGERACVSPRTVHPANITCIKEENWCDGVVHCPQSEDEHYCANCSSAEYECDNHRCMPLSKRCDGTNDCGDWSDEFFCVKIEEDHTALVNHAGDWINICLPNQDENLAGYLCALATSGSFLSFPESTITRNNTASFTVTTDTLGAIRSHSIQRTTSDCVVLKLQCKPQECGTSILSPVERVIDGAVAPLGLYPSTLALIRNSSSYHGHYCGATLISPNYAITAAHCVENYAADLYLHGGAVHYNNFDDQGIDIEIESVINHPNVDLTNTILNDVAILKLRVPVASSSTLSPACIPPENTDIFSYDSCYVLGWGVTEYDSVSKELLMKQVDFVVEEDTERCEDKIRLRYDIISPSIVCVNNREKHSPICFGDSGGPLICKNSHGRLELVGVTSFGDTVCLNSKLTDIYENLLFHLDFIYSNTDLEP